MVKMEQSEGPVTTVVGPWDNVAAHGINGDAFPADWREIHDCIKRVC